MLRISRKVFIKANLSRAVSFSLAVMLLASSLVSLLISGGYASAAAKPVSAMALIDQARSYTYVYALEDCMLNADMNGGIDYNIVSESNASSGNWFGTSWVNEDHTAPVGYLDNDNKTDGDKNEMECNDIVRLSSAHWGYSNTQLLCKFSLRQDGTCEDSSSGSSWKIGVDGISREDAVSNFHAAIMKEVYGGATISKSPEINYLLAYAAFFNENACTAKKLGPDGKTPNDKLDPNDDSNDLGYYPDIPLLESVQKTKVTYYLPGTDISTKTGFETSANDPSVVENSNAISAMINAGVNPPSKTVVYTENIKKVYDFYGASESTSRKIDPTERKNCEEIAGILKDNFVKYKDWMDSHDNETVATTVEEGVDCAANPDDSACAIATSSCVIEGVGWIICPVMDFLSMATDAMYNLVSQWLKIDVSLIDTGSGTYKGWAVMRDLANVGFVLVFLIIIFSQISGLGLSNYGIKRLLPKLIVVAILINVSFFVTQLAVDISNVLGVSLKNFLDGAAVFDATQGGFLANGNTFTDAWAMLATGGVALAAGAVVAAGAVAYGGIGLLVMVLLAAIIAVGTTMLILAARTALIVILIVVAPLAFLAMILPNTKKWYDKWRQMFVSMLVIFPMISIVFAASEMAAKILVQDTGGDIIKIILGLAVATIPMFATIPMIKGSLNAIPVLGNLAQKAMRATSAPLGGAINARSKAARANFGNAARASILNSGGTGRFDRGAKWLAGGRVRRAQSDRSFASSSARAEAGYGADYTLRDGSNASVSDRAAAVQQRHKLDEEEIANIMTLQKSQSAGALLEQLKDPAQAAKLSKNDRAAAIRAIGERGGQGDKDGLVALANAKANPHLGGDEFAEIAQVALKGGVNNPGFSGSQIPKIQSGEFNPESAHLDYLKQSLSAKGYLSMHEKSREALHAAVMGSGDQSAVAALARIRDQINENPLTQTEASGPLMAQLTTTIDAASQIPGQGELLGRDLVIDHTPTNSGPTSGSGNGTGTPAGS